MPLNRPFALSVGLAAGVVAAVGCYSAAAGVGASAQLPSRGQGVPAAEVVTPQPSVSFAPCVAPAKLEHGACVTHTVVTKVLPAPSRATAVTVQGSTSAGHSEHRTSSAWKAAAPATSRDSSEAEHEDATELEDATEHEDANEQEDATEHEDTGDHDQPEGDTGDDSGESHSG